MTAIAVGPMRPKAAGSGERTSVGARSGSVRLGKMAAKSAEYISLALIINKILAKQSTEHKTKQNCSSKQR